MQILGFPFILLFSLLAQNTYIFTTYVARAVHLHLALSINSFSANHKMGPFLKSKLSTLPKFTGSLSSKDKNTFFLRNWENTPVFSSSAEWLSVMSNLFIVFILTFKLFCEVSLRCSSHHVIKENSVWGKDDGILLKSTDPTLPLLNLTKTFPFWRRALV